MSEQERMDAFVADLNRIEWRTAPAVTPKAEELITEHIRRLRAVMRHLHDRRALKPAEAYDEALAAGNEAPGYEEVMDLLFNAVSFRGAGVREHLILVLASQYSWERDEEMGALENPWTPLLELYRLGYTSSFEEDEKEQTVDLLVGHQGGIDRYSIA